MTARLTSSRMRSARSCQRRHHLEWDLGVIPTKEMDALRFGTLCHKWLEAWWSATGDSRLADALHVLHSEPNQDPFDLAKAEAMLRGYHLRWKDEPLIALAVEVSFDTPLINPDTGAPSKTWALGGTIDVVVRDERDGRVFVMEHKTSALDISPGSDYWKRLRMDGQVSTYFVGGASLGYPIDGCIYDVLGKPALRPLKATPREARKYKKDGSLYANQRDADETPAAYLVRVMEAIAAEPSAYFQRGDVVRLEDEMRSHMRDVWQLAVQLRDARAAQSWPRNPDACVSYGTTCPFFGVCTGEESLEDPSRFTMQQDSKEESRI